MTRRAVLLLTLILLFDPESSAYAIIYQSSQASGYRVIDIRCSWGQTWVNNTQGSPSLQSVATMDASVSGFCDNTTFVTGRLTIGVAQDLIAWDNAGGYEFLCSQGPWQNNGAASHDVWTGYAFNRPCGANWFRGDGLASIRFNNRWYGNEKPPIPTGWISV
jgi:hypothetical protein